MELDVFNMDGQKVRTIELPAAIFEAPVNVDLMHQAYVRQMANARLGTHSTKTRGEVSGGGRKPWKQKGTGRARQGSTRAPHWKGGGTVFGPTPRSYEQRMPKKMRRLALKSALSAKAAEDQIRVIDAFTFETPRTKDMDAFLGGINCPTTTLILLPKAEDIVVRAARNLTGVKTLRTGYMNVRDLLGYDYLVLTREALQAIERFFGEAEAAATETEGE